MQSTPRFKALRCSLIAAALAWGSIARAEPPDSAPQDWTPHPALFFFDVVATLELAPRREAPSPTPTQLLAGATASLGVRARAFSLPPTHQPANAYRAFGVGAGLQGTALSDRFAAGPVLRLSYFSFDKESPRRQLPDLELYGFASPWAGIQDPGTTSWAPASGGRFGIGFTALAWSNAVMDVAGCHVSGTGEGAVFSQLFCVMSAPLWGPFAMLNHAEVFADVAHSRSRSLTPRVGLSFGLGF